MKNAFNPPDLSEVSEHLRIISSNEPLNKDDLQLIIKLIDLTSLEGNDTKEKIKVLCHKAIGNRPNYPASVCIFPRFIKVAKKNLEGTGIKVAAVAGGFPNGQSSRKLKIQEIRSALKQGADEIDFTICRGLFLEKKFDKVFEEIANAKEECGNIPLKVILETGELGSNKTIYYASMTALNAGADFIKTSTGKISTGATHESVCTMLIAIREFYKTTGKTAGIKPSGGISNTRDASVYLNLTKNILGQKWLVKDKFRIGASRLFDESLKELGKF